mmetsp:Transcript_19164/g.55688  ORF Transcript_19164/g.55688 Transcript_19164/m.55688 type:complete len:212 (-) Transcript_19164:1337-1972(-)
MLRHPEMKPQAREALQLARPARVDGGARCPGCGRSFPALPGQPKRRAQLQSLRLPPGRRKKRKKSKKSRATTRTTARASPPVLTVNSKEKRTTCRRTGLSRSRWTKSSFPMLSTARGKVGTHSPGFGKHGCLDFLLPQSRRRTALHLSPTVVFFHRRTPHRRQRLPHPIMLPHRRHSGVLFSVPHRLKPTELKLSPVRPWRAQRPSECTRG